MYKNIIILIHYFRFIKLNNYATIFLFKVHAYQKKKSSLYWANNEKYKSSTKFMIFVLFSKTKFFFTGLFEQLAVRVKKVSFYIFPDEERCISLICRAVIRITDTDDIIRKLIILTITKVFK